MPETAKPGIQKGRQPADPPLSPVTPMDHACPPPLPPRPPAVADAWVSMRHLQRAAVFLAARGMPAAELLAAAGLSSEQLADGERQVPLQAVEDLLAVYQARQADPLLGLHLADSIQPATLGALGHLLQACGTMADLLDVTVRFNGLMSNIGHTSVMHYPGLVEVRWDCLAGSDALRRQACEYIVGTFHVLTHILAPGVPQPVAVQFPHPRPSRPELLREYFDFFGCPVHFDRPHASVTAPAALLHVQLPHGDAVLKDMLERHTQHLLSRRTGSPSLTHDVKRLLKALILGGTPTKDTVAQQLGTSTRSLHRRLEEAGTSYRELLDAMRLELAREQLDAGRASITEITERLGFSSPQAFMRWFRQLVGVTPSQYRSGHQ